MKILIVSQGPLPYPGSSGCSVQIWSIIQTFLRRGHQLCFFGFNVTDDNFAGTNAIARLKQQGVRVYIVPQKAEQPKSKWAARFDMLRKIFSPKVEDFFNGPKYREELNRFMDAEKPDIIYCYTLDAALAVDTNKAAGVVKAISVIDLDHLVHYYRYKYDIAKSLKKKVRLALNQFAARKVKSTLLNTLKKFDIVFEHADHHKNWLQEQGIKNVFYFPVNVLDNADSVLEAKRTGNYPKRDKMNIVLLGNIRGIATRMGLFFLAEEIMPELEKAGVTDRIHIKIVGGGKLDPRLAEPFKKNYIELAGYIEDIDEVFLAADVVLVPTPMDLGFRTRIVESFSYAACVIAHHANKLGMPEIRHNENALVGNTGKEIAGLIIECLENPAKRKSIGDAARQTFEKELSGDKITSSMAELMENSMTKTNVKQTAVAS